MRVSPGDLTTRLSTLAFVLAATTAHAQEWTRFRGPNGSGLATAKTVPAKPTADDVRWTVELPGRGNGSPVLWGTKLFLLAEKDDGATRVVLCIDARTGESLWQKEYAVGTHKKHKQNSYASSTPACDAERLYVGWATKERITLLALTHDGEEVWQRDLGPFKAGHGYAISPSVQGDLVILGNDQEGDSSLFAFHAKTGETAWQVPRPKSVRATYSTPCLYQAPGGKPELVFTNWQHGITGVDPKTGAVNWEISVFDVDRKERAIGSPFVAGDLVVGTCGFTTAQKHLVAVQPTAAGIKEVYRIERNVPHVPTALHYAGDLYLWGDKGVVACHDAADGELLWQGRVTGNYYGSPVCVDGRLYAVDDTGVLHVVATGEDFEELAEFDLGEGCHSTPAVANGTLFVRTHSKLVAIGRKE